ncbi:MAG TPA: tetratricopeptide repeat protein, partial [Saprospiraceae bacterium]|nr:tetratricopeptide repeat protein [Saprospiraceae bacterium]
MAIKEIDSLILVSRNLMSKNDFEKALEVNAIAEKLVLEKFDSTVILYASLCFNKAWVLHLKGDIHDSEVNYLKVKYIQEKSIGRENSVYALTLNNLGLLYLDIDRFEKAEMLLTEALSIRKLV